MIGAAFQNLQFHRFVESENKLMCRWWWWWWGGAGYMDGRGEGDKDVKTSSYKISHWHVMNSPGNIVNN